jgi:hypothetical protein
VSITQEDKPEGLAADVLEEGWNTVGLVASGEEKKKEVTSKKKVRKIKLQLHSKKLLLHST